MTTLRRPSLASTQSPSSFALQMGSSEGDAQFLGDLTRLRADALIMLGWITLGISYFCLILLVWPITGTSMSSVAWFGTMTLMVASGVAILASRRKQRFARYLYAVGINLAAACGMVTLGEAAGAYLFLLPIIFASVLFNRWLALTNALLAITLIPFLNQAALGVSPWSATALTAVAITAITAVASWLAAHNLYTAFTWLSSAYANANTNQRLARERQAELQRALKALDEAHYRLRRLNGLLASARDQAEEGKRIKQYFAQTISHELRTPLNLVVGFAELMIGSPEYYGSALPPPYLRDLRIIYRNAHHLQGLVNDVLDLSRIEAAQMSLVLARVDPEELAREAVETVRSLVESRGLALTTQIEAGLPCLWLDATRIRQVLINLLNNASRFTPQGSVTVTLQKLGNDLRFAVRDTGIGIPPLDLARIFDEFYQVDGGSNRRQEGAGLGLAISRKFVTLHGGRMWAESQQGKGSTFFFTLPLAPLDLPHLSEPLLNTPLNGLGSAGHDETGGSHPAGHDAERVLLVVTASNSAVGHLSRYLPRYRVLAAADLGQAQRLARQVIPQAVVLDSHSVALNSSELTELARLWGLPQVPVITCPLPGEEPLRRRLAVDGYLIKPVMRQNLWDLIRTFGESIEHILIVDDNRDFVRLLRQMLNNPLRPYQVESAHSGEEALALLAQKLPDLILLDLGLPDLSGAAVVELLRSHPLWRSIPIVVVSAQDELDGLEVLHGALTVTKASGLLPGDLIRWLGAVMSPSATNQKVMS